MHCCMNKKKYTATIIEINVLNFDIFVVLQDNVALFWFMYDVLKKRVIINCCGFTVVVMQHFWLRIKL